MCAELNFEVFYTRVWGLYVLTASPIQRAARLQAELRTQGRACARRASNAPKNERSSMSPCYWASLSAEQNSVRRWSIALILFSLANTYNFVNFLNIVAGIAGAGGAVTGLLALVCGPRNKEHDRSSTYKAVVVFTLLLIAAFAYSIYYAFGLLQLLQMAIGQFMLACCGGTQCIPAMQATCTAAVSSFASGIPFIIGSIILMTLTIVIGIFYVCRLVIALKKRSEPVAPSGGKGPAKPSGPLDA